MFVHFCKIVNPENAPKEPTVYALWTNTPGLPVEESQVDLLWSYTEHMASWEKTHDLLAKVGLADMVRINYQDAV